MDTCSTLNNKIRKARIRIVVYVLMLMMLRAKIKTCTVVKYMRSGSLTFTVPLFCCNWVDAIKGVVKDKYRFISIDLNRQGYKSDPFLLENTSLKVSYVPDTTNKVIPEK
jgi:hypothetical protein